MVHTGFAVLTAGVCLYACAAQASGTLRESALGATSSTLLMSAQHTYFSRDFDLIGYSDSLPGTSRPSEYQLSQVALDYKLDRWRPFVRYERGSGSVMRELQPFEVNSDARYMSLGLAYSLGDADQGMTSSFRLASASQDDLTIDCYERSGTVLGGSCEEADFQLVDGDLLLKTGESRAFPVLSTSGSAVTIDLSLDWWRRWAGRPILIGHSISLVGSEIKHENFSPLYDIESAFLLNTPLNGSTLGGVIRGLKDDLPQSSPWQEAVLRYDMSASFFSGDWIFGVALGGLYAHRFNYSDPLRREQYHVNWIASGEIWYQFDQASMYLKGEAFSNYLLGVDALAYTSKSSRFFDYPYGQLTVGFVLGF